VSALRGGGGENKVVSASTNILANSLKANACVMSAIIANVGPMEHSLGGNSYCYLFANMALIFAINFTKDSTFAIPTTKESTFASMVAFHSTYNTSP